MTRKPTAAATDWPSLTMQAWSLGVDASWVIWTRCARLAEGGPAAGREAQRMVQEKWQAQVDLTAALMTGRLGTAPADIASGTLDHYGTRVRANRKRLAQRQASRTG